MGMLPDVREMISKRNTTKASDLKWYSKYKETATDEVIDGNEIRQFLDWTPKTPEQPRYARIWKYVHTGKTAMTTYLDSELVPVEE